MSAKRWTEIRYTRVPSVCMAINKMRFFKHDPEGFQQYLVDVKSGKRKISGATLMPHELVAEAMRLQAELDKNGPKFPKVAEAKANMVRQEMEVVDAQWLTLVSRLKESGTLGNSLAICDVSGSMGSIGHYNKNYVSPIFPSVSLSLMLASLAKPPFNAGFITFSHNPKFVRLGELVNKMVKVNWSMNTDFQTVFLKLLEKDEFTPLNVMKKALLKRSFDGLVAVD